MYSTPKKKNKNKNKNKNKKQKNKKKKTQKRKKQKEHWKNIHQCLKGSEIIHFFFQKIHIINHAPQLN